MDWFPKKTGPSIAPREQMVLQQIERRGIQAPAVLAAMRRVPRECFFPLEAAGIAYADQAAPIGWGQTISQPYIVALMSEWLDVEPDHRVLEIGTGSGYQTAVLAELAASVFTAEIVPELGRQAQETLGRLGYTNIRFRVGDGFDAWMDQAPFDRVLVTAAPPEMPGRLPAMLNKLGVAVLPVGTGEQVLMRVRKAADGFTTERGLPVRFVPLQ